jgi:hypothetical protein
MTLAVVVQVEVSVWWPVANELLAVVVQVEVSVWRPVANVLQLINTLDSTAVVSWAR